MIIRPAKIDDLDSVRTCAERAYEMYVPRMGKKPAPMIADFAAQIDDRILYVLCDADQICGYVVFYPRADHLHLENVAVSPEHQGMGYGTRLIAFVEQEAARRDIKAIELYTNEKMTENIDYYPHLGFRELGRREEDGFNRVFFRKEL